MLQLQEKLIRLARVDPLTGTLNRRAFFDEAQRQCRLATAAAKPVAIMFDVDHFKRVNDQFGHDIGDMVLRAIGENVPSHPATVGRLGGEEFAILIENSDLSAGVELSENLRTKLAALSFDTLLGNLSITCSFGVSEWRDGETIDELLKRADIALYTAKNDGRNRVVSETAFHLSLNKHLKTSSIRARSREESIA
jgi:diguanylate cyclase (GGDEF)-like protein